MSEHPESSAEQSWDEEYGAEVEPGPEEASLDHAWEALDAGEPQKALEYWRITTQALIGDNEAPEGSDVRKTYSHMASAQANLLANHNYTAEAEQTYRLAMEMEPSNQEAVYSLAGLLNKTGRSDEARQLVDSFAREHPSQPGLPVSFVIMGGKKETK